MSELNQDAIQTGEDVDWVNRRFKCDGKSIFECLRNRAKIDVARMNSARKSDLFFVNGDHPETFVASVNKPDPDKCARFSLDGETISIDVAMGGSSIDSMRVSHQWDAETASCNLQVDGKTIELWKISQRALSPLFFGA